MDEMQHTQVNDPNEKRFFTKRQRQAHIDMLLHALDGVDLDFESTMYATYDFFHSVFMNGMTSQASSEEEKNKSLGRVVKTANRMLDVIEEENNPIGAEDMAAMLTVLLDFTDFMLREQKEQQKQGKI